MGIAQGREADPDGVVEWVVAAGCSAPVVSLGVDAAAEDPESPLLVTREGAALGGTGFPAVVVQEGGYHLPTLGALIATYLAGHGSAGSGPGGSS